MHTKIQNFGGETSQKASTWKTEDCRITLRCIRGMLDLRIGKGWIELAQDNA